MIVPVRDKHIMHYVYVLKSLKDGKWYTGCAGDLRKRFSEHNDGKVNSTKGRGPFELIYYEASLDREDAFAREKYLKSGMGKRYLKNRLKRFLFGIAGTQNESK
jgi:putative endonuclease